MKDSFTQDLVARLESRRSSLTPVGRRLLDLLLEDLEAASRLTISELSERVGASEASVVRTSRALGYRGYPELRLALAAASTATPRTVVGDITRDDDLGTVLRKLAHQESAALEQTARGLDQEALALTVEAVAGARRVDVYGVAASSLVAMDLAHKLQRIGRACQTHPDRHLAVTSAALLGTDDVAIGISHSGLTPDVVEPLRRARESGATTVAITSSHRTPLARLADHLLVCAGTEERAFRPAATASRISQLLVVDAVFVRVAQHTFDTTTAALQATRDAVARLQHSRPRR